MKRHRFWAWAMIACLFMTLYTPVIAREELLKTSRHWAYAEAVQINEERARLEAEQMFSGEEDWEEETAPAGKDHLTETNNFTETGVFGEQGI